MTRALTPMTFFVAVALGACGGAPDSPEEPSGRATNEPSAGHEDDLPRPEDWAAMNHDERAAWMSGEVMPRMQALFASHDAERYAVCDCGTCHGEGAQSGDFHMPSRSLPALPTTGTPEQRVMVDRHRPMLVFMYQQVLPTMQTLLGAPDYDEEMQLGFSCFACHPHAGDEGTRPLITLEPTAAGEGEAPDAG